jgi:hypothetical protein
MAAYAPFTVVSGKTPEDLARAINHVAQFGYQPIPGGFVDRGAKGVWCTCELESPDQAHLSSEEAAKSRLAEAQAQAEALVAAARDEAEAIREHGPAGIRQPVEPPQKAPVAAQNRPQFGRDPIAATQTPPPPPAPKSEPAPKPQGVSLDQILRPGLGGAQPEPHG